MSGAPADVEHHLERPLLCGDQAILGWLAVDQEAPLRRERGRRLRAVRPILLAHHEEQPDPRFAGSDQLLRSGDHRGHDPLRVARAATMDRELGFANRQLGWYRIDVRREHQHRIAAVGVEIVPTLAHGLQAHLPAAATEIVGEEGGHGLFPTRW